MAFSLTVAQRGQRSPWNVVVDAVSAQYGVDANLIRAFISQESQWNPGAINPSDPSYGLMQILQGSRGWYPDYTPEQLLDPATNITLGVQIVRTLVNQYGDTSVAISVYNEGAGRYAQSGIINQPYVDAVQTYWTWFVNNPPVYNDDGTIADPGPADGGVGDATLGIVIAVVALAALAMMGHRA